MAAVLFKIISGKIFLTTQRVFLAVVLVISSNCYSSTTSKECSNINYSVYVSVLPQNPIDLMYPVAPPYPFFKNADVVNIVKDPSTRTGYIYILHAPVSFAQEKFQGGAIISIAENMPEWSTNLGYNVKKLQGESGGYIILYADVRGFNERVDTMRKNSHPLASPFKFAGDSTTNIDAVGFENYISFARLIARGVAPISLMASTKDHLSLNGHDSLGDAPGYLLFEPKAAAIVQERFKTIISLYEDPILQANPAFEQFMRNEIKPRVKLMDLAATSLTEAVAHTTLLPPTERTKYLSTALFSIIESVAGAGKNSTDPYISDIEVSLSHQSGPLDKLTRDEYYRFIHHTISRPATHTLSRSEIKALAESHALLIISQMQLP